LPGSSTLSGKSATEFISNSSEIKPFHFIASINAAYEPGRFGRVLLLAGGGSLGSGIDAVLMQFNLGIAAKARPSVSMNLYCESSENPPYQRGEEGETTAVVNTTTVVKPSRGL
jgi:hypothetical protein